LGEEVVTILNRIALGCAIIVTLASPSLAQTHYPDRLVRFIVPFSAGSITDNLARLLSEKLADIWKQQVIVENRPGIPGTIAVANSPSDGYTLMVASNGHTTAAVLNKDIQFDPIKDFAGVTKIASVPQVLVVPADAPMKSFAEFIALARKEPGRLNFGSAGISSTTYLCAEVMRQTAKINIVHVPYKGTPEATTATIRNDVQMYLAPIPLAASMAAAGKLKAIGVNAPSRLEQFPTLATFDEVIPGFSCDSWFAVLAPAKTPRDVLNKISADIATVLKMPDVVAKLATQGAFAAPTTPEELDKQLKHESVVYAKILRDAGVAVR
jgi:tripartite-type tricarboxylate transporter receptor subunit TctC